MSYDDVKWLQAEDVFQIADIICNDIYPKGLRIYTKRSMVC